MITRHINRTKDIRRDNYTRLALYIAGKNSEKNKEKILYTWHDGCMSEDYNEAILETTLTQEMNTRSQKEKTYHLLISFRPEDEAVLTEEIFKEIEQSFSKVLGFEKHQRHCGVHGNTNNMHMHIAYNMINPVTYNRVAPYYDYSKRDKLARELEKKYGLTVDIGKKDNKKTKNNTRARIIDIKGGLESFDSYVKNHKEPILQALEKAQSWDNIYKELGIHGLTIVPMGNGLVIKDKYSKHSIKASSLDRKFSKNNLEKLFGKYETDKTPPEIIQEQGRYTKKPTQKQTPERDALFKQYQTLNTKRKEQYEAIDKVYKEQAEIIKNRWEKERFMLSQVALLQRDRSEAIKITRLKEKEALAQLKTSVNIEKLGVREKNPSSWNKFLIKEADNGNETALEILRYKNIDIDIEKSKKGNEILKNQSQENIKSAYRQKQIDVLSNYTITSNIKKGLTAVLKMEELQELSGDSGLIKASPTIDHKGIVIFNLTSGGNIRDTGKEIHYSSHNLKVKEIAEQYAKHRWGENFYIDKNKFVFNFKEQKAEKPIEQLEKERHQRQQKNQDMSR